MKKVALGLLGLVLFAWALLALRSALVPPSQASEKASEVERASSSNEIALPTNGRAVAGSPPESGPPESESVGRSPEDGLRAVAAVGERLGPALDFVTPTPDIEVLLGLRSLVELHGLTAGELLGAAKELSFGDPRARALTVASAWGDRSDWQAGEQADQLLAEWARSGVEGGTLMEQHALAAIWALDLGQRSGALEQLAGELLADAVSTESGDLEFPGLMNVRTWFALRAIEASATRSAESQALLRQLPSSAQDRIARELWALGVRSRAAGFVELALESAHASNDAARSGLEAIDDDLYRAQLTGLALSPAESDRAWLPTSALRGLVRIANSESLGILKEALGREELIREQALEALRTWRVPRQPAKQINALLSLRAELGSDALALTAIDHGLERAITWTSVRRLSANERDTLVSVLEDSLARVGSSGPERAALEHWLSRAR